MTAELICVGTELLLGNIVNTNAAYLSEKCALLGLSMYYQSVVGDNPERLEELLEAAKKRSDIILLSGGLGPTKDDLTKETAARVMHLPLIEDEKAKENMMHIFKHYNRKITENNWKQALVPQGSIVLYNANGTAPGIIMESEEVRMILLPGPPGELIPMFENQVMDYLRGLNPDIICSKMIKLCGIGESAAETEIIDLIEHQSNPTIAPYAKTGEVHLRITAKAKDERSAYQLLKPLEEELFHRFGSLIYATEESVSLEEAICQLLKQEQVTLATVESCTGGLLAGRLVNAAGISHVFQQGFITYSNAAKEKMTAVPHEILKEFGAVSKETALAMAKGGAAASGADVCLAVTGIAGPDGGTAEKPVGLVYIGIYYRGGVCAEKCRFQGNRSKIRENTVVRALTILRDVLLGVLCFDTKEG